MGSPGSGKTAVLEATARIMAGVRLGAVSADLATDNDARRLEAAGIPSRAITTGQACHLDAELVHRSLHDFPWRELDVFFIENVGNLVCPAIYDLGQEANVVVLSVTEGEDKPLKYPVMFRKADLVLLTKCDLVPHLEVDLRKIEDALARVMPEPKLIRVSARTGEGLGPWKAWIEAKRAGGVGWAFVDANYMRPPATTAEILHPERAATRHLLAPADRPSAAELPTGMRVLYADTFGEWMLGTLLERAGAPDARALAAEWQDDRILFFEPRRMEGETWPVGFVWRIRAASPDAARRLAAALAPLYERSEGRPVAAIAVVEDRVEVVRGRPRAQKPVSSPAGISAPPAGR